MIIKYNGNLASDYAQKWALGANPRYYHFGGLGGDCTNFISQCLLYGGGVMNYEKYSGWYYNSTSDRAPSWTSVLYLQKFLLRKADSVGPFASISTLDNLKVGDLIQLRQNVNQFNHTVIISKIENSNIYVCAHSNNAFNKPLSSYKYLEALGLHIEGVKV